MPSHKRAYQWAHGRAFPWPLSHPCLGRLASMVGTTYSQPMSFQTDNIMWREVHFLRKPWYFCFGMIIRSTPESFSFKFSCSWESQNITSSFVMLSAEIQVGASSMQKWGCTEGNSTIFSSSGDLCLEDLALSFIPPMKFDSLHSWLPEGNSCTCFANSMLI